MLLLIDLTHFCTQGIFLFSKYINTLLLTVQNSISVPANENSSRYERFVDPPPMNRYYYRLVDKDLERVYLTHTYDNGNNVLLVYRRVGSTQLTQM